MRVRVRVWVRVRLRITVCVWVRFLYLHFNPLYYQLYLLDNLQTNQLTFSRVVDWSTRGLDDSRTSQLAEMSDARFGVNNCSKCYIYKFAVRDFTSLRIVQSAS